MFDVSNKINPCDPICKRIEKTGHFQPRQMHAETCVHPMAKANMAAHITFDIESIWIAKARRIPVGSAKNHEHARGCRNFDPRNHTILCDEARKRLDRCVESNNFFVNERCEDRKGVALTGSGLMREYDWAGNLIWEHKDPYQHHDARRLEKGGTVYLAYTQMSAEEQARVIGGVQGSESEGGLFGEVVREIDHAGEVIWEWDLAQLGLDRFPLHANANRWSQGHTNTIEPLPDGNYLVSCKVLNLIFIIDRKTDQLIWSYQNDEMGGQHDAQLLDNGNILLFANGAYASDLHHSQVWELDPQSNQIVWQYKAKDNPQGFFSPHIGGCQRLSSGNTLICEGAKGCIFEVTPEGDVIWEYICPYFNETPGFGKINWLFRARHYAPGSPELQHLEV